MKIITMGNQKGGCAKTTTSLNVCYSLANTYEKKVLLIDMDSQGSASLNLGIDIASDDVHTIDEILEPYVLNKVRSIKWEALKQCIYTPTYQDRERDPENRMVWRQINRPYGFDIIPSSLYLSVVELEMGVVGGATGKGIYQFYLRDLVEVLKEHTDYDFVIIDTPPSLGALSINSMAAAVDGIIVVSNTDVMSIRGVDSFIESSNTVKTANPAHRGVMGILLSLYSERRTVDRSIDEWVQEFLPIPTFDTRIPETSDVKKANSSMLLVSQINKKMKAAFDSVTNEILFATEYPDQPIGSARKAAMEE